MSNVKLVRLQNGSDIISVTEEIMEGHYLLTDPMVYDVNNRGTTSHIMLSFFLPIQLVEKNEVVLTSKDILFITKPNDDFAEYYENSVDNLKKMDTENEFQDEVQEELNERIKGLIVQAFENMEVDPEGKTIH
jgi:hypothetical protein